MLAAPPLKITRHAVDQYRARVLGCPERFRGDKVLREVISNQVAGNPWHCVGGETFEIRFGPLVPKRKKPWEMKVLSVTYRYVIECQTVVTILGFMMRPNHRKAQRRRRQRRVEGLLHTNGDL